MADDTALAPPESGTMDQRTTDLGSAALGPLMVKLSIPGMVGMVSMALYNIVDAYWVAGLPTGTQAIAALTVLMPFMMIAGAVGMGVSAGVMSLVSRRFGATRVDEANQAAGQGVLLSVGMGLVFMVVGLVAAHPLVRALGATPEVIGPSVVFLQTVSLGFPFAMSGGALGGLFRGAGNTWTPMVITLSGTLVTAVLDPFLIYGWYGCPRLEMQGAAIATICGQLVSAYVAARYMCGPRSGYHLRWHHLRLRPQVMWDILEVGAPAAATMVLRGIVASLINHVLGGFGAAAIAGVGLGNRVMFLIIACLGGSVNQALTPIVGYAFGARDYRRMWYAYRFAAVWTGTGGFILGVLVILFAPWIIKPFAHDAELQRLGVLALRLQISTFFLVEPQMMAVFTLQGMGKGAAAMWLTVSRGAVLVLPLVYVMSAYWGVLGAYASQPVADALGLLLAVWTMAKVYRQYPPTAVPATA